MPKYIPEGYHSVTPCITFKDSAKAIEFYQTAFDAKVLERFATPDGKRVMHASIRIGDSVLMMGDECPGPESHKSAQTTGTCPVGFYFYVPDADSVFMKALKAGAVSVMPVAEMFWGDRCGTVKDPFGHCWWIGTHAKDLTSRQIEEGAHAFYAEMSKGNK